MPDRILLRSIEFYGFHGVPPAERETGHRFAVDLALETDLRSAGITDDLRETVDYGDVCRQVLAVGQGPPLQLIETLAERIAATCLTCYPKIDAVEVTVRKLFPPVPAVIAEAAVHIRRERSPG